MRAHIGIDLIEISRFKKTMERGGEVFGRQNFTSHEISTCTPDQLASNFAVKEAVFKTGYLPHQVYTHIQVVRDTHGKPNVCSPDGNIIEELSVSVSNTDTHVVAIVLWVSTK